MNRVAKKQGFTIIELMLAMGFVSVLLVAVAMTVIQVSNIYNRGITLKDVNQAGRAISTELQNSITNTSSFSVDTAAPGSKYIRQSWGGRLCIGQYSYIWNYGANIAAGNPASLNNYSDSSNLIRFVRAVDANSRYCTAVAGVYPSVPFADAAELLDKGQHNLAIHSFDISALASAGDTKTGQQLYSIQFLIGTNNQSALTGTLGSTTCRPPNDVNADPSYCSVNAFSIVARSGNVVE
jgi:type II secretory pathway pseudopilin PulG